MEAANKPSANVAITTHTARARRSQRPCRVVAGVEARVLIPNYHSRHASAKRYDNRYEQEPLKTTRWPSSRSSARHVARPQNRTGSTRHLRKIENTQSFLEGHG